MLQPVWGDLALPFTLLIAWFAGELGQHRLGFPRIATYGIAGVAIALVLRASANLFPIGDGWQLTLLAQIGFGLLLFEFGYRINLLWLRRNPWLTACALTEAVLTFAATYWIARQFDFDGMASLLMAALGTASSPLVLVPVIKELRSSGQLTERMLHHAALHCLTAILVFNTLAGIQVLTNAGTLFAAGWNSLVVLLVSTVLGGAFGMAMPKVLALCGAHEKSSALAFALAVAMLILVTHSLHFSPILATLVFGLIARHRRRISHLGQPAFGPLGDLLCIVLFIHLGSRLQPETFSASITIAACLLGARLLLRCGCQLAFARLSGLSFKKAWLTGFALMPSATFSVLLLEQAAHRGVQLPALLVPACGLLLLFDLMSPLLLRRTLRAAGETDKEG